VKPLAAGLALAGAIGCGGHRAGLSGDAPGGTCAPAALGTVRLERIALWRDDAQGAYSIITTTPAASASTASRAWPCPRWSAAACGRAWARS